MMAKKLKPVHPGEILREEFMAPLALSMNKMAMALRVPVTRIADIVNERRGITADTALRFARYFKKSSFLDESPDALRFGSCSGRDCCQGCARRATAGISLRARGLETRASRHDPHTQTRREGHPPFVRCRPVADMP